MSINYLKGKNAKVYYEYFKNISKSVFKEED